jgi:hypothetical protein
MIHLDELVKSRKMSFFVIPAPHEVWDKLQPESRNNKHFWNPAFAGVTALNTFYEAITSSICNVKRPMINAK